MQGHRRYLDLQPYVRTWVRPPEKRRHMRYIEPRWSIEPRAKVGGNDG